MKEKFVLNIHSFLSSNFIAKEGKKKKKKKIRSTIGEKQSFQTATLG
jgi:hypothetical protein